MGGATGTDSMAASVPLLSKVWQNKILPCHVLVKILKHVGANLTHFHPYVMLSDNHIFPTCS